MRFWVLFVGLCLGAAGAAWAHSELVLPELPIPVIDQLIPADNMEQAFRWADREPWVGWRRQEAGGVVSWATEFFDLPLQPSSNRWHVVALSESHFGRVAELLASIQQPLNNTISEYDDDWCKGLDGRFGIYLQGWSQGGADDEFFWTFGAGLRSNGGGYRDTYTEIGGYDWGWSNYLLRNRFSVAGGDWASNTLRDTGFSMRFRFTLVDDANCVESHISHADGSARHGRRRHSHTGRQYDGPWTAWIPIADLLDGTVSITPPADPEDPEEPEVPEVEEPAAPADQSAELARLQAELDALRGENDALRDSLASRTAIGGGRQVVRDTVLVSHTDTLLFCPQTDEERRDLFDLFTGVDDDTTETEGAGKAASVEVSSWGAIKSLIGDRE